MTAADRPHVDSMQRLLFPPPNGLASLDKGQWWIAYEPGKDMKQLAGFCAVCPSAQFKDTAYLLRVGVMPAYRGKGLQKRFIRLRARWAREQGFSWLVTDTTNNPASSNSLISEGFKLYEPTRPWSFDNALYWRKKLC